MTARSDALSVARPLPWLTSDCMCTVDGCDGSGYTSCSGCGGDQCICGCGGEGGPCPGCDACEAPRVCPGCYAVAPERCAPGCIDAEMAREREKGALYGDHGRGLDDEEEDCDG